MLSVTFCFLYYINIVKPADFNDYRGINPVSVFEAANPFQYRILIPLLYRLMSACGIFPQKILLTLLNIVILYLTLVFFSMLLNSYFHNKTKNSIIALSIFYPMTWNYILLNEVFQYYDLCAVLIFTMGMYFIIRENFKLLLLTFIIGILNKESAVFLIFAYAFYKYKALFTKKIIMNLFLLSAVFIAIKALFFILFRHNPGGMIEPKFSGNIEILSSIFQNMIFTKNLLLNFGGLYVFIILMFVTGRWKNSSHSDNKGLLYMNFTIIPFFIVGAFTLNFHEVRVYSELIPMVTILFLIYVSTYKELNIIPANNLLINQEGQKL
jgi:hypothetical protein